MSGARYVRFYPSDWRSGCIGMSLEEEGFYMRACAHFYETGKRLPADDKHAASRLMMDVRQYRRLKAILVDKGKLHEQDDGYSIPRCELELELAKAAAGKAAGEEIQERMGAGRHVSRKLENRRDALLPGRDPLPNSVAEVGQTSPGLRRDFAGTSPGLPPDPCRNAEQNQSPLKEPELNRKKDPLPPCRGPSVADALTAFEQWNATALRCGLPQAAKLTPDRQRKIIARLRDYGLDGWSQALANIERSSFLTGKNDRNWRADLGFLLQAGSFSKVHDGGFGNGRHAGKSADDFRIDPATPRNLKPREEAAPC